MGKLLPVPKRNQKRARVWLAGVIAGADWAQDVQVRDLSEGGALLSCELPPPVETGLSFWCGDLEIPARVAWVSNNWVGVEFLAPVDLRTLTAETSLGLRVSAPRKYSRFDSEG